MNNGKLTPARRHTIVKLLAAGNTLDVACRRRRRPPGHRLPLACR